MATAGLYARFGAAAVAGQVLAGLVFWIAYFVLLERAVARFHPLKPQSCSIYDPYFSWHERFWKLVIPAFDTAFGGTPFKNLVSRLLWVRLAMPDAAQGAARAFWRSMLLGTPTTIPRWTLEPVPDTAQLDAEVPAAVATGLSRLGVPLGSALLAAHATVLSALTGEDEVTAGYLASALDARFRCG